MKKIDKYEMRDFSPIDISFEKNDSTFHADFLGKHFKDTDINKLKTQLSDEAEARKKITWKPVIKVTAGKWEWDRSVSGIETEIMFLGTIILPDGASRQVLSDRGIKDIYKDEFDVSNWTPCFGQTVWKGDTKEVRLIDYTEERYKTLAFIEERMTEFKLGLREVIVGEEGSNFLDVLSKNTAMFLPGTMGKKELMPATEEKKKETHE